MVKSAVKTAVDAKTLFEIGSSPRRSPDGRRDVVSDGKMHWIRLTNDLPDFRMYDPAANEGVTIRDALAHRSGIAAASWSGSRRYFARRGPAPFPFPQARVGVPFELRIRT